jgi:hypothetical protein
VRTEANQLPFSPRSVCQGAYAETSTAADIYLGGVVHRKKKLEELDSDIQSQFDATSWGKKLTQKKLRAGLSDFGRFKVAIAKQKRNKTIAEKLAAKVA